MTAVPGVGWSESSVDAMPRAHHASAPHDEVEDRDTTLAATLGERRDPRRSWHGGVLARPVIRRLAGHHNLYRRRQLVDLRQVAGAPADRWRAIPVRLPPEQQRGAPARHLGSGMLSGAATADGLALIPPGSTDLTAVVVELW